MKKTTQKTLAPLAKAATPILLSSLAMTATIAGTTPSTIATSLNTTAGATSSTIVGMVAAPLTITAGVTSITPASSATITGDALGTVVGTTTSTATNSLAVRIQTLPSAQLTTQSCPFHSTSIPTATTRAQGQSTVAVTPQFYTIQNDVMNS
ncbi:hypothetical protein NE237_003915 [Protea cynaroides]|uniref:Uncharacterized protein n=1 Tax=Protea cynaroides TaxID=273540 RepID=A0A9Q0KIC1_9MAGN|nr:hypothetical protein NE237_003915 [Protea cynaroides]